MVSQFRNCQVLRVSTNNSNSSIPLKNYETNLNFSTELHVNHVNERFVFSSRRVALGPAG